PNPLPRFGEPGEFLPGERPPQGVGAECLEILVKESQRLNKLLSNFLDFARPRLPRLQPAEPIDLVKSVAALAQHTASREGVILEVVREGEAHEIACDPEQIKQLLL